MSKGPISKRQQLILDYMKAQILERGFPPSVREICDAVSLKSTSSVHAHLEALEKNGYIKKDPTKPRAIEILDDDFQGIRLGRFVQTEDVAPTSEIAQVPVLGDVAAGLPLLAVEQVQSYFPFPVDRLPNKETFLLKVRGDSMIEAAILDGDYVLVEQSQAARNGEIVVALVDDSATVKRFYQENGYVRLQPENSSMEPILVYGDLQILGKVIGVMRYL